MEENKEIIKEKDLCITSTNELKGYSRGEVIELPPFGPGQPFIARVIRPSMLALVKSGKIPNELLLTANQLFKEGGKGMDEDNINMLNDMYDVMEAIIEASLLQPTLKEVREAGMELTDDQKMFLFSYSQTGVKALNNFRKK